LLLFTLLITAGSLLGQSPDELLTELRPQGYVSDFASVFGSERGAVEQLLTELEQKTGA